MEGVIPMVVIQIVRPLLGCGHWPGVPGWVTPLTHSDISITSCPPLSQHGSLSLITGCGHSDHLDEIHWGCETQEEWVQSETSFWLHLCCGTRPIRGGLGSLQPTAALHCFVCHKEQRGGRKYPLIFCIFIINDLSYHFNSYLFLIKEIKIVLWFFLGNPVSMSAES